MPVGECRAGGGSLFVSLRQTYSIHSLLDHFASSKPTVAHMYVCTGIIGMNTKY